MTERSKLDREYRRLTTYMNVPLVDENVYIRSLGNRDIPYDTKLCTLTTRIAEQSSPILDLLHLTAS